MKKYIFLVLLAMATTSIAAQDWDFNEVEYTPKETTFTLFAPSDYACVMVVLYGHGKKTEVEIPRSKVLKRVGENLWQCKIKGDLKGKFYTFYVSDKLKKGLYTYNTLGIAKYTDHFGPTPGVFAKAVGVNGMRGAIVDMKDSNPAGWEHDQRPALKSPADLIIYGMGEKPIVELAKMIDRGESREAVLCLPQSAALVEEKHRFAISGPTDIVLHSHEECLSDKRAQAENFRHIEEQSNMMHAQRLLQHVGRQVVVVNPPYPPMTTEELDASFDLPYTRQPHPKYKGKRIPAYDMIKFSVNIHRGCFGGCAFCTISAHQGKFITCRSKESILREVKQVIKMPDFKGYLSDLGGPSANMYGMHGRNLNACERCRRPSCIHPQICPNLDTSHQKLLDIYHAVDALPGIKKSFIGSGVRYDLLLYKSKDEAANRSAEQYTRELICRHVSGRLKVAPEHTSDRVLHFMRKPSFRLFGDFKRIFDRINREENLRQQIIPYFISSHPGCREEDMAELAVLTKNMDFQLEQVQDFTPTPMTVATETWYTGYDPYTLEPVFSARSPREKLAQRQFFFWYKPEERRAIEQSLRRMGRPDLIARLFSGNWNHKHRHP